MNVRAPGCRLSMKAESEGAQTGLVLCQRVDSISKDTLRERLSPQQQRGVNLMIDVGNYLFAPRT